MMFPKEQWRGGPLYMGMPESASEKTVQWNKMWLADKIRQGYQVVDIGPDGRATPSRFYLAEQEAIRETGASKATLKKFENGETVAEMRQRVCLC
jgi:hypothetical protein